MCCVGTINRGGGTGLTNRTPDAAYIDAHRRITAALQHHTFAVLGIADYADHIAAVILAEFPVAFYTPAQMEVPQSRALCLRTHAEPTPA